jgi:tRNA threonylcarbamoyladenosine biosynthesis protein TsaB
LIRNLVVGIETSNVVCSVAWWQQGEVLLEYNIESPNNHATLLPKLFTEGLTIIHCEPDDIGLICVTSGPGSFTGLRIGMSYAKGLCYGLRKPIISVSNFELLAYQAPKNALPIYTLIDARHDRAYMGIFQKDQKTLSSKSIIPKSQFEDTIIKDCFLVVHNKYKLDDRLLQKYKNRVIYGKFDMNLLCQLGYQKFVNGMQDNLVMLEPLYIQPFAGIA